jgi:hypothetical protein
MTIREIGCCGAYCGSCKEMTKGLCKGCKLRYDTGERNIDRAKCRIKLCCFRDHGFQTCADCGDFDDCEIIRSWLSKGYKYKRYGKSLIFIRDSGYVEFLKIADGWNDAVGKM